MSILTQTAAANYNCNAYGAGTYNTSDCSAGSVSSSGALAATGFDILIPLALGLSLVIAGAILIAKRLLRRRRLAGNN